MLEGLVRLWLRSLPAVYVHIWPGGSVGLEMHLTFLVGVLVPVMVWFSCHGSVVPGIKDARFWYSVARPLLHLLWCWSSRGRGWVFLRQMPMLVRFKA